MNKKIFIALNILFFMIISMFGNISPTTAEIIPAENQESISGSTMSPGYAYVPANIVNTPFALGLKNNDQPGYLESYYYQGGLPLEKTMYYPPNFETTVNFGSEDIYNSLFAHSTSQNFAQDAGFLKYGNILPTASERELLENFTSFPDYQSEYGWVDKFYDNENATSDATMQFTLIRNNATLKEGRWSSFEVDHDYPISIAFDTKGEKSLHVLYVAQYTGFTEIMIRSSTGTILTSGTVTGVSGSTYFFYPDFSDDATNTIFVHLNTNYKSELDLQINRVSEDKSEKIKLNEVKINEQDIQVKDMKYTADPFSFFERTQVIQYKYEVPEEMDGKFFKFVFDYNSYNSYTGNPVLLSNSGKFRSLNSPIMGNAGEVWYVIFRVYSNDAYYVYLKLIEYEVPDYTLGNDIDLVFPDYADPQYYFKVNIGSDGLYNVFYETEDLGDVVSGPVLKVAESSVIQNRLSWTIYDENGTSHKSYTAEYVDQCIYLESGTYYMLFNGEADNIMSRFYLKSLAPVIAPATSTVGIRSAQVIRIDNVEDQNIYEVTIALQSSNIDANFVLEAYNAGGEKITTKTFFLSSAGTTEITYNLTHVNWLGTIYLRTYLTTIEDTSEANRKDLQITTTVEVYENDAIEPEYITVTPTSAGLFSVNATSDYAGGFLYVNFESLKAKTWYTIELVATGTLSYSTGDLFGLTQLPSVFMIRELTNYPEYTVENNGTDLIHRIGFGSMNTTAEFLLIVDRSIMDVGHIQVSLVEHNTKEISIQYPALGDEEPEAKNAPNVADFGGSGGGAASGFLVIPMILGIGVLVISNKKRKI